MGILPEPYESESRNCQLHLRRLKRSCGLREPGPITPPTNGWEKSDALEIFMRSRTKRRYSPNFEVPVGEIQCVVD